MSEDSKLSRRLMARSESGIYRRQMSDGGSVVSGPIVRRALRAVGARAFTWDKEIFVDDTFDANNPDDVALYAHERFHQMHSGGMDVGADHQHSAEEKGAQAIERMVLHRAHAGEDVGSIMRDVSRQGAGMTSGAGAPNRRTVGSEQPVVDGASDAEKAVMKLLGQGIPYDVVVRDLTTYCVRELRKAREAASLRRSKHEYF